MSRFRAQFTSAAAIAVDTVFGYVNCVAGNGYNLRRVTGGLVTLASTSAPPDQDCLLGIAALTSAGVTPTSVTPTKLNQNSPASTLVVASGFSSAGAFSAATADPFQVPVSSRGGFDLYWEAVEEWQVLAGVTNGLAFVNRGNALLTPLAWKIMVEWEE